MTLQEGLHPPAFVFICPNKVKFGLKCSFNGDHVKNKELG